MQEEPEGISSSATPFPKMDKHDFSEKPTSKAAAKGGRHFPLLWILQLSGMVCVLYLELVLDIPCSYFWRS